MTRMKNAHKMTEDKAFKEDVKKMSYDDLMDAIRYLDEERQDIAERVEASLEQNNAESKIIKRSA